MGDDGPCGGTLDSSFPVVGEASAPSKPCEGTLDHPAAREQNKALGGVAAAHDIEAPLPAGRCRAKHRNSAEPSRAEGNPWAASAIGNRLLPDRGSRSSPRAGWYCEACRRPSPRAALARSAPTRHRANRLDNAGPNGYAAAGRYRPTSLNPRSFLAKLKNQRYASAASATR